MKFLIQLRRSKSSYILFGAFIEFNTKQPQYLNETYRNTIAFIPPQKYEEGLNLKLWGYDKTKDKDLNERTTK